MNHNNDNNDNSDLPAFARGIAGPWASSNTI